MSLLPGRAHQLLDLGEPLWYNIYMPNSHRDDLTGRSPYAQFFLTPEKSIHRQYEALRAYFVEGHPSSVAAQRLGYSPGAFRVLCHEFRHRMNRQEHFFRETRPGPQSAPTRDAVRELVVAMRKRNLSVYDIQRELAEEGHSISVNALSILLREEGFARLPRRRDDERPPTVKPEPAQVADVRGLDFSPRSFRTRLAGLFVFVPLMRHIDTRKIACEAALPGSRMIPAEQALRTLLALKLMGKERKSHVMDLVFDEGLALFAGLNAPPKRAYLCGYSSRIGRAKNLKLMETWFQHASDAGLRRGNSIDVDFHTVAANTGKEPLQNHYVSKRGRSQKGVLVFLARDADERVLCYSNASIPKERKADEILRFVEFWKQQTGQVPQELVFDSQLTTQPNLRKLEEENIRFITLRRRSNKMLAEIYARPSSAWKRVTLRSLTRTFRHPRVYEEKVLLPGYNQGEDVTVKKLRQLAITDLGHDDPTILLTNDFKATAPTLITRYAKRMLIENGIADAINFFHIDALSSMVGLKVDFDLQITLMASALYRLLADHLDLLYRDATAKRLFNNLLDLSGRVDIDRRYVHVFIDKRAHNPYLVDSGLTEHPTPMPWFGNRKLVIQLS